MCVIRERNVCLERGCRDDLYVSIDEVESSGHAYLCQVIMYPSCTLRTVCRMIITTVIAREMLEHLVHLFRRYVRERRLDPALL